MPDFWKGLIDQRGRPIEKRVLTEEVAGATLTGVRTPHTGYPADGLNPIRLAAIMKEADQGHPVRQLELAETIEERDPHLIGVLGTRRRSVSQLDIIVDAASSDPLHKKQAEMVRDWLARDELQSELFDMLDAIHKGYSFTEIIWSASEGQWRPERLEWRDPRWFDFDRRDLTTPLLLTEGGQSVPLPGGKFIYNRMPAKSGIPTRSGLSRITAWAWMFKAFTMRDWAIFTRSSRRSRRWRPMSARSWAAPPRSATRPTGASSIRTGRPTRRATFTSTWTRSGATPTSTSSASTTTSP
jgi:phage gp29-like protein